MDKPRAIPQHTTAPYVLRQHHMVLLDFLGEDAMMMTKLDDEDRVEALGLLDLCLPQLQRIDLI